MNPWWTPFVALFGAGLALITFLWNLGREIHDRRRRVALAVPANDAIRQV